MSEYGINTQRFRVVESFTEAEKAAKDLNAEEVVVKAQVLTGGRGKGIFTSGLKGGVQLSRDPVQIASLTKQMLGSNLITHQTGPQGLPVHKVMLAEAKDLSRETYFAILLDRDAGGAVMVGSPMGGVDIESVAAETPELLHTEVITGEGPSKEQLESFAGKLGFSQAEGTLDAAVDQMSRLYKLFTAVDATQVEINPFGVTPQKEVLCFDAKIAFDDNAKFRQERIFSQADTSAEDQREVEAAKHGLNYIGMDGDIGCLVNGAGLAMATMDLIKMCGGNPANFLDVGGSAHADQIAAAMRLLNNDAQVKVILVNIFGGIMRCDVIAEGILKAHAEGLVSKPVVVRLNGTMAEAGMEMLAQSDLAVKVHADLDDAAQSAVSLLSAKKAQPMAMAL